MSAITYKKTAEKLDVQLDKLLKIVESTETQEAAIEKVKALKAKNQDKEFRVLVLGEFSSGKSALINALVGKQILPEGALTVTATITEIKYAEKAKAIVYPRESVKAPFEVPVEKVEEYLKINHNNDDKNKTANTIEGNIISSAYEKVEVFLPLEILKDGVVLIDSPGLNDPEFNGEITKKYINNVHAIIFCVSGLKAYSATEKALLMESVETYYDTPIFAVTRCDNVLADIKNSCKTEEKAEEEYNKFKKVLTKDLGKHTSLVKPKYTSSLDGNGVFFVSSLEAKNAKKSSPQDLELLQKSGFQDFERYLSDYLIKYKGEELSNSIVKGIQAIGNETVKSLNAQYNASDMSLEEIEKRIHDAKSTMENVTGQAKNLIQAFELEISQTLFDLRPFCRELPRQAYNLVDQWAEEYEPTVQVRVLTPKKSMEMFGKDMQAYMDSRFRNFSSQWCDKTLVPEIRERIKKIGKDLYDRVQDFDKTIANLREELELVQPSTFQPNGQKSEVSKFLGFFYSLTTGDFITGSAIAVGGPEAAINGLLGLGAGAVVMMVLGTVIAGWPLIISAVIIDALVTGGLTRRTIEKSLRREVVRGYKNFFSDYSRINEIVSSLLKELEKHFNNLSIEVKKSAYAEINQIQSEVNKLLEDKRKGEEAVEARRKQIRQWISDIETIKVTTEQIRAEGNA
ncbi:MAG: dynamin family protein [Thermoguttaceae bacterium]